PTQVLLRHLDVAELAMDVPKGVRGVKLLDGVSQLFAEIQRLLQAPDGTVERLHAFQDGAEVVEVPDDRVEVSPFAIEGLGLLGVPECLFVPALVPAKQTQAPQGIPLAPRVAALTAQAKRGLEGGGASIEPSEQRE